MGGQVGVWAPLMPNERVGVVAEVVLLYVSARPTIIT